MALIPPANVRTIRTIDNDGNVVGVRFEMQMLLFNTETGQLTTQMSPWLPLEYNIVDEPIGANTTVEDLVAALPPVNLPGL